MYNNGDITEYSHFAFNVFEILNMSDIHALDIHYILTYLFKYIDF